jgi:hypothetical protein
MLRKDTLTHKSKIKILKNRKIKKSKNKKFKKSKNQNIKYRKIKKYKKIINDRCLEKVTHAHTHVQEHTHTTIRG